MAKISGYGKVTGEIVIILTEEEAGALDALVGYGFKPFIEVFYEKMGKAYLQPWEKGLKSLFESVKSGDGSVAHFLTKVKEARDVFEERKKAVYDVKE